VALVGVRLAGFAALAPLLTLPVALPLMRSVARERGRALNPLLGRTAKLLFLHGALFSLGLSLGTAAP
jgi:hypothetical protein